MDNDVHSDSGRPSAGVSERHSRLPSHFIGGNVISVAPPSKVKDFVAASDGHTVITKVCFLLESVQGSLFSLYSVIFSTAGF